VCEWQIAEYIIYGLERQKSAFWNTSELKHKGNKCLKCGIYLIYIYIYIREVLVYLLVSCLFMKCMIQGIASEVAKWR
jgi:hypothetical protein